MPIIATTTGSDMEHEQTNIGVSRFRKNQNRKFEMLLELHRNPVLEIMQRAMEALNITMLSLFLKLQHLNSHYCLYSRHVRKLSNP
ncbi:hypothetical protein GQ457_15G028490 [Hibiscus cannabinus]